MSNITIRPFKSSDTPKLIALFQQAVRALTTRHYSSEQIEAWAPQDMDETKWRTSLGKNISFVAEIDSQIVGFADITHDGYLDRLFVHKDYQARGVGLRLIKKIIQVAKELGLSKITTHCSITAKKLAERIGFVVIKEQTVERKGIELTNYVMEKKL